MAIANHSTATAAMTTLTMMVHEHGDYDVCENGDIDVHAVGFRDDDDDDHNHHHHHDADDGGGGGGGGGGWWYLQYCHSMIMNGHCDSNSAFCHCSHLCSCSSPLSPQHQHCAEATSALPLGTWPPSTTILSST